MKIYNIIIEYTMNTVEEFVKFFESTITTQGEMLGSLMKLNVVATSKNSWYAFNQESKLWESQQDEEFYSYLNNYLNSLITKINELLETKECECETNKQLLKQLAKKSGQKIEIQGDKSKCTCDVSKLKELAKLFDKKNYIKDIRERFFKSMLDKDFEKKLNSNPEILSLQGGKKINLRTLEVSVKTPNDYCTFACNVSYVTETPNADRFFKDIMPNEEHRKHLQKVLGWMLTGDTKARKFQTWYGNGANGKSVVLGLLKKILNDYYVTADKAVFVKSTFQSKGSEASPHLYSLLGKRVIAYSEGETSDNFELDLSVLKNISGEDPIRCRGLFKDQIEFLSQGKLVLATNYVPPLTTEDAIKDRTLVIFFDQRFTDKPQKDEKLKDVAFVESLHNEYLSEVFTWMVKGSKIYYEENRKVEMPEELKNLPTL
jgi:P4 family phage/plasmid primase-like protien